MPQSNTQLSPLRAYLGTIPKEGPQVIPFIFDFSVQSNYEIDLTLIAQQGKISGVQGLYIDNASNDQPISILTSIINQTVTIPSQSQAYLPCLVSNQVKLTVTSANATGIATVMLLNFPVAAGVWDALQAGGGGTIPDPLPVSNSDLTALAGALNSNNTDSLIIYNVDWNEFLVNLQNNSVNTGSYSSFYMTQIPQTIGNISDGSGTIVAGGVAQQIFAASSDRVKFRIQNLDGAENLYICDTGGVAAIDTPGSWMILPGGYMESDSVESISVIAASAGHKFTATESYAN